jgi:hypothetical protein
MVLLMNPAAFFTVASSFVGPTGIAEVPVVLPDNPAAWADHVPQLILLDTGSAAG